MTMKKKRIGVNVFPLTRIKTGIGFYIFYLLEELIRLHPDTFFFLYAPSNEGDVKHFLHYPNVTLRVCPFFQFSHLLWMESTLAFFLWKDKIDLFWGTTQTIPFFQRKKMKTFLSLYDFTYLIVPNSMTFLLRSYFKLFMRRTLKKTDYIFPISQGTAEKLKSFYEYDHHGIIYPPLKSAISMKNKLDVEIKLKQCGLTYNGYIISIGTLEPRKNFLKLLEMYCLLLQTHSLNDLLPLVLVGGGGWKNQDIQEFLFESERKYPTHIKFLGYLNDEELSYFLSGANHYLTLSLYEGYGMPIAESRLCGTPIACFDIPEMREAAENEGIFLSQEKIESQFASIFLHKNSSEKKKSVMTKYKSNQEVAMILSKIINLL